MKHKLVENFCKSLGLTVRKDGPDSYSATQEGVRVYWRASPTSGTLLGLPRVAAAGRDSHARNLKEISYLVKS